MESFSSATAAAAYKHHHHHHNPHDTSLWTSAARDTNVTSHYRLYPEYQDAFETRSLGGNSENPSFDLYDLPYHHQSFFSYLPHESSYYHSRPLQTQMRKGDVSINHGEGFKGEELYLINQPGNNTGTCKGQTSSRPAIPANDNALKGFMDLVNKASSFWINKFAEPCTSTSAKQQEVQATQETATKNLFGNKDLKLTISYPCLISTNALNQHRAAFEAQEGSLSTRKTSNSDTKRVEREMEDEDNVKPEKIFQKKIKKSPKPVKEKWGNVHDQKLLSLVQNIGCNWDEVAKAFMESSVTAKYVRERYKALAKKDSTRPKRQAFTREEDREIAKYYKIYGGNWDRISKFFPTRRSAVIRNRFYASIKGNLEELLNEADKLGGAQTVGEKQQQEIKIQVNQSVQSSDQEENKDLDMDIEGFQVKSQEDILDSYFNKEDIREGVGLVDHIAHGSNRFFEEANLREVKEALERTQEAVNSLMFTRKMEEDVVGGHAWGDKPTKEAIEILNGRISLLTSLYNQTRIELVKLQNDDRDL